MFLARDEKAAPDLFDFQAATSIMVDIENRSGGYLTMMLAQWISTVRKYEREKLIDKLT